MPRYDFDMFTIGAGSGGVASSRRAGAYGARVAICEELRVGGTCVLRGCVPKKLLVYGAQFADAFADAEGFGWTVNIATYVADDTIEDFHGLRDIAGGLGGVSLNQPLDLLQVEPGDIN